jgi:glycosyltransferase involved in cell wall biosynthesis
MKFNICTNLDNGVGLERDYRTLKVLLESWGHQVYGVHFKRIDGGTPRADVNIFLETMASAIFPIAKQQWLIPNQEWWAPWDHEADMRRVDRILCKTQDAVKIFSDLYGATRVQHIGFESQDLYDPTIERKKIFLHVAGQSRYKNSQAVAYAFAKCFDDPSDPSINRQLVFVGAYPEEVQFARDHKNVRYIQHASAAELKHLMNECLFHIMPSGAEGWGHALHEGFGCGAVVITTDFPPMNEFAGADKELLVPYQRAIPELAAQRAFVGAMEVKHAIEKAWTLTSDRINSIQAKAREYFLVQRDDFRTKFKAVVESA